MYEVSQNGMSRVSYVDGNTKDHTTTAKAGADKDSRFVDGAPRCTSNKEAEKVKQMKENDSSSVSRKESACNSRTAEERMENSSSSTGGNLTRTKIESKDVMFIVLQKNTRSMNSTAVCEVQE